MEIQQLLENKPFEEIKELLRKAPYFLKVKDKDNLYLLHYTKKSNKKDPFIQRCYGLILEKNTNQVVCYGLNYIKEYPDTYEYKDFKVEELVDGTVVKLYYYDEKWVTATNKCIDANESRWISTYSFHQLFEEASEGVLDYKLLDQKKCYTFVLVHPNNRNIVPYEKKEIYHISTRNLETLEELNDDIKVQKPKIVEFKDMKEINKDLDKSSYKTGGYIILDNQMRRTKILNPEYLNVKKLKGNTPNIYYRIMILYLYDKRDEFLKYFPEYEQNFIDIHNAIYQECKNLQNKYINRYVNHRPTKLTESERIILFHLHKDYKETGVQRDINIVIEKFKKYSPKRIFNMLEL